jgi:transposase
MAKYRTFTPEFKAQVVLEILTGAQTAAAVCREHHLKDSLVSRWKQEFLQDAAKVFSVMTRIRTRKPGSPNWSGWSDA